MPQDEADEINRLQQEIDAHKFQEVEWNPEDRYSPVGSRTEKKTVDMIEATKKLLKVL